MKKRIYTILLSVMVMVNTFTFVGYTDSGISVTLNGEKLSFDVPPQLIDNRTMVPLRIIFEAMGADVDWNNDTQTVTATKEDERVIATINSKNVYINGETKELDVPPLVIDGRTLVPVRFVAEAFGANVNWDAENKNVVINLGEIPTDAEISIFVKDTKIKELDKEYTHFGMTYKVPSDWGEPVSSNENIYYYPLNGMLMIQRQDNVYDELDEDGMNQILESMSKSIQDYKTISINKISLKHNDFKAYSAEFSGVITNMSTNAKIVVIQSANFVYNIIYSNFDQSSNSMKQFDAIIDTIFIEADGINKNDGDNGASRLEDTPEYSVFESISIIESYLYEKYSKLDTDIGKYTFSYDVTDYGYYSEDFCIDVKANGPDLGLLFEYDTVVLGNYLDSEIENSKEQLKSFMKKLATDLIDKLPNKKLTGSYRDSHYRYPNLKMNLIIEDYCTWANYDRGNENDVIGTSIFRWLPNLDRRREY